MGILEKYQKKIDRIKESLKRIDDKNIKAPHNLIKQLENLL